MNAVKFATDVGVAAQTAGRASNPKEGAVHILVEGQAIKHELYGAGVVTESNTERTTIDFDDHGVKKFVTSMWTAELVGEPPATPPGKRRGRRKTAKKKAEK
jgi:hypothetical protein